LKRAIIAAIEACTDTCVEVVVGKPSVHTAEAILNLLGLSPERCLMIGDRLETDVKLGLDAGMSTALVLSGVTEETALEASEFVPSYVLRRFDDLIPGGA
jgi:ribonucleotide monophosphatase NagD (HAD superfamily)